MGRKRPRRPGQDEFASYLVQITSWDWSYSFGLSVGRYERGPYSDHRHLKIEGTLLRPRSVKAEIVELTFMPDIRDSEVGRTNDKPVAVGSLDLHDGRLIGLISMPTDALQPVMQMLIAGRSKYVALHGYRLRYRKSLVRSYRLETGYEEDNWSEDE